MNTKFHPARHVQTYLKETPSSPLRKAQKQVWGIGLTGDRKDVLLGEGDDWGAAQVAARDTLARDYPSRTL